MHLIFWAFYNHFILREGQNYVRIVKYAPSQRVVHPTANKTGLPPKAPPTNPKKLRSYIVRKGAAQKNLHTKTGTLPAASPGRLHSCNVPLLLAVSHALSACFAHWARQTLMPTKGCKSCFFADEDDVLQKDLHTKKTPCIMHGVFAYIHLS